MRANIRGFLAVVGMALMASAARADNWPQWRGPTHDGISTEKGIATEWDEKKNVLWKVKMPGMGSSTPVVWDKHIFVTSEKGSDLVLVCVGTDGKEKWERKLGSGNKSARGGEGNSASPSCCTDGKYVWAYVGTGDLACFDFEGKEIWKINAQDRYGQFKYDFGMHSTPVLHGDHLYFQVINPGGQWVVSLEKATGKEVWKVKRESDGVAECLHSYASVTLWKKGDKATLISHGNDYTLGHDLKDGKEIWRVADLNPKEGYDRTLRFVATPVASADLIVIPSAKKGPLVGLSPEATGTIKRGEKGELWRYKSTTDVPSPVIHDGLVYVARENGQVHCLDAKTGKEHYTERTVNDRHRASPVFVNGHLYMTAREGTVTVIKGGTKFEILSKNKLPDQITASLAISNGRIYIRGWDYLYCIGSASTP